MASERTPSARWPRVQRQLLLSIGIYNIVGTHPSAPRRMFDAECMADFSIFALDSAKAALAHIMLPDSSFYDRVQKRTQCLPRKWIRLCGTGLRFNAQTNVPPAQSGNSLNRNPVPQSLIHFRGRHCVLFWTLA